MFTTYREQLPDYAKDLKLNLSKVFTEQSSDALSHAQALGVALAVAYATKDNRLISEVATEAEQQLDANHIEAIQAATSIMAMNNIYYRFMHFLDDNEYRKLPANLRMNVMANPGIDRINFELYSLAVSAINGCGLCVTAHTNTLEKHGLTKQQIQHAIRIAAVINGLAQVNAITAHSNQTITA